MSIDWTQMKTAEQLAHEAHEAAVDSARAKRTQAPLYQPSGRPTDRHCGTSPSRRAFLRTSTGRLSRSKNNVKNCSQ
jgi:hypothetical protein